MPVPRTVFRGKALPVVTLLLLSPAIPELLTGSTPYWRFLDPIPLTILVIVYGLPAMLYREYVLSRKLSMEKLLFIGLAQGLYIEGVLVNTFYETRYEKLGDFTWYGRLFGVNWSWAFYIVMFHSMFSVYAPIMLTETLFPRFSEELVVLSSRRRTIAMLMIIAFASILFQLDPGVYKPNPLYQLICLLSISLIIWLSSREFSKPRLLDKIVYPYKPLYLVLFPIVFVLFEFYVTYKVLPPILHVLIGVLTYTSLYNLVKKLDRENQRSVAVYTTLGLALLGFATALLDHQYHIIPVSLTFTILALLTINLNWKRYGASRAPME